jgi:photosystem II stability/assembly factor-like uncharacterized protein
MSKRLLVLAIAFLAAGSVAAQPWMAGHEGDKVKLQDLVEEYRRSNAGAELEEEEIVPATYKHDSPAEEGSYHFDRWVWYMQRHLDSAGYIVPRSKTLEEWLASGAIAGVNGTAAKTAARASDWKFRGPSTTPSGYMGIGRVQVITFHPTDSNTYWVGTAGGGAWKTSNDGVSWTCMTDMLPVLGVADIVINPYNPQIIYLCSGDRDNTDNSSIGVLKSVDGGLSWNATGYANTVQQSRQTNALAMNPQDTSVLVLATSTGIYKTTDAGATWNLMTPGNFKQIIYRPLDSNIVFATGRPVSGGGYGIYRSGDAGNSWTATYTHASSTRIAIAISPAAPHIVKAVVANSANGLDGVYRSADTGKSFARIFSGTPCNNNFLNGSANLSASSCGGQAWYDLVLTISPIDTNKLLVGGVNTWQSSNGGASWNIATQWNGGLPGIKVVHADKHFMAFQPLRPRVLFEGNDGGIYKTMNPTSQLWSDLSNGLCVTQFYRNAVSNGASFVLGGAQDNGSKMIDFGGLSDELTGGDGMQCAIDYSDPDIFYTAIQNGLIYRTMTGGTNFDQISNNIPGSPKGEWITPYVIDPRFPSTLYAGYDMVYRSDDYGETWNAISPELVNNRNMTHLAATVAASGTLYAVVNNEVHYTTNAGNVWSKLNSVPNGSISDIIVSPKDARNIWVTYNGYGSNKVYEYDTTRGWTNHTAGLPNIPVNCITIDTSSGTTYIGTDVAVYYMDSSGIWQIYNNKLPAAEVTDLSINYKTGVLWAATYGRGMWESPTRDAKTPSSGIGTTSPTLANIYIAPNPVVDGTFTLTTESASLAGRNVLVVIMDMSGKTVWTARAPISNIGTLRINAGSLPRGQYTVQVQSDNGVAANAKLAVL